MTEEIVVYASLAAIAEDWEALAARMGVWPFLRPGWIRAWWKAFGKGKLVVHALRRGGNLAGVLPVAVRGHNAYSPTNWHTPAYGPVAEDEDAARTVLDSVLAQSPRRLKLSFLDPEMPGLGHLRQPGSGYRFSERVVMRSPYVSTDGDWEGYRKTLSRNHRKSLRRTRRRLEELGPVTLEVSDRESQLPESFRIEASGWKGTSGTAISSADDTRQFYGDVADWASREGLLRLAFLRVDGRGIATSIALEDDRRHYFLKTGFDPEFSSLGPGRLLVEDMIRRSFDLGHESFEFLGADAPYKDRWTDTCRDRIEAQLFASSLSGHLDRLVRARGMQAGRRLRASLSR
jgi:CelD/BcsL family acetyltransferase involved in cellulose biosynthesis